MSAWLYKSKPPSQISSPPGPTHLFWVGAYTYPLFPKDEDQFHFFLWDRALNLYRRVFNIPPSIKEFSMGHPIKEKTTPSPLKFLLRTNLPYIHFENRNKHADSYGFEWGGAGCFSMQNMNLLIFFAFKPVTYQDLDARDPLYRMEFC